MHINSFWPRNWSKKDIIDREKITFMIKLFQKVGMFYASKFEAAVKAMQ